MMLFGYLFRWSGFQGATDEANPFLSELSQVPQFTDVTGKQGVKVASEIPLMWHVLNFRSGEPLAGEEQDGRMLKDYEYRVFVRVNPLSGSVIFASSRYKISDSAVATFNAYIAPKLQRRHIRVAELSERLFHQRSRADYFVTYFLADVPGYGEALKMLSLAGDDVAGAGFFSFDKSSQSSSQSGVLHYSDFTARQIGLRPIDSRQECGRFGGTGTIQFPDEAIQELDKFLIYANV